MGLGYIKDLWFIIEQYGIKYIFIFCYIILVVVMVLKNKIDKYFDSSIILIFVGITLAFLSAAEVKFKLEYITWPYVLSFIVSIIIGAYGLTEMKVDKSKIDKK